MKTLDTSLPDLAKLLQQRLALVGSLAESLEASRLALGRNDAEAIARGAAHQAELCRQWARLEAELRAEAARRRSALSNSSPFPTSAPNSPSLVAAPASVNHDPTIESSACLEADWVALEARIRYLARVHWSLLRHMQRSLAAMVRIATRSAPTYAPVPRLMNDPPRLRAGE